MNGQSQRHHLILADKDSDSRSSLGNLSYLCASDTALRCAPYTPTPRGFECLIVAVTVKIKPLPHLSPIPLSCTYLLYPLREP